MSVKKIKEDDMIAGAVVGVKEVWSGKDSLGRGCLVRET